MMKRVGATFFKSIAMKSKIFHFASVFFLFYSSASKSQGVDTYLYIKENVAIVDAFVRSIDGERYVKEVYLVDFKNTIKLPDIIEFNDVIFLDNGLGYDAIARDGVYASFDLFMHTKSVPFQLEGKRRSVMDVTIVDVNFAQKSTLESFISSYKAAGASGKIKVTVDCDVYVCTCYKSCSCKTCGVPLFSVTGGYLGFVQHCLKIVNCHVEITWQ